VIVGAIHSDSFHLETANRTVIAYTTDNKRIGLMVLRLSTP